MKTLKRVKLNQLSKSELEDREMKSLVGGCSGVCGCRADNKDNLNANSQGGLHVPGGYCEDFDAGYLPDVYVKP